jgi:lysyl-tRNA synthetase, class II
MTSVVSVDTQTGGTTRATPSGTRNTRIAILHDDRWPDRFAALMLAASGLVLLATFIPPWHRYFGRDWDIVSALTIPLVPSLVYGALLFVMAVALRRRLRAAWWLLVIWWLILPQLSRIVFVIAGVSTSGQLVS